MHNNKMDRHGMQAALFRCLGTQGETTLKMDKHGHSTARLIHNRKLKY